MLKVVLLSTAFCVVTAGASRKPRSSAPVPVRAAVPFKAAPVKVDDQVVEEKPLTPEDLELIELERLIAELDAVANNVTNATTANETSPPPVAPVKPPPPVPVAPNYTSVDDFPVVFKNRPVSICEVADAMWSLDDETRAVVGRDLVINTDPRKGPLFKFVNQKVFATPLYKSFLALLDNYNPLTADPEDDTPEKVKERNAFLDAVIATKPIKLLKKYIAARNFSPDTTDAAVRTLLVDLWFTPFGRGGGRLSSSGFEHTFVGEVARGSSMSSLEITGFHNWIQFSILEKSKTVSFDRWKNTPVAETLPTGKRNPHSADPTPDVGTIGLSWTVENGVTASKGTTSMYIGTSPAYEMAVFTLFLAYGLDGDNYCTIGEYETNIVAHTLSRSGKTTSGTAYAAPEQWNGPRKY